MEQFDALGWLAGFGFLVVVDFLWFQIDWVWKNVYGLDKIVDFTGDDNSLKQLTGAVAVLSCAAAGSAVLTVFRGTSREDAAAAGATIGGLVFFVFNACTYYILNNLRASIVNAVDQGKSRWSAWTALADLLYGTGLYTAAAVIIFEVSA